MKTLNKLLGYALVILVLAACVKKTENCIDGIQNQGETKTDCGGPCGPCATCVDGLMNQDETGIDCGGSCPPCATCSDGIQNQGETDVDCGGPCTNACSIYYPETGSAGKNLLYIDSTRVLQNNDAPEKKMYSFKCVLPKGTKIKVVLKRLTEPGLWWFVPSTAWKFTSWDGVSQTFTSTGPSTSELQMLFTYTGAVEFQIYENDSPTPNKIKGYLWN